MVPACQSLDEFYWKYRLQRELSVLWDAGGKGTRITWECNTQTVIILGTCDIWTLLCLGPGTHISDPGKFCRVQTLVWTISDVRR